MLGANNFVEPFKHLIQFLRRHRAHAFANAFDRERAELANLYPRRLWQATASEFQRERERGALTLARQ